MTELATTPEILRLEREVEGLIHALLSGPLTDEIMKRVYDQNIHPLAHRLAALHLQEKGRKS